MTNTCLSLAWAEGPIPVQTYISEQLQDLCGQRGVGVLQVATQTRGPHLRTLVVPPTSLVVEVKHGRHVLQFGPQFFVGEVRTHLRRHGHCVT